MEALVRLAGPGLTVADGGTYRPEPLSSKGSGTMGYTKNGGRLSGGQAEDDLKPPGGRWTTCEAAEVVGGPRGDWAGHAGDDRRVAGTTRGA